MDALQEIVKAHIRAGRAYYEMAVIERACGLSEREALQRAELVTSCQFYKAVEEILEKAEYQE
jgi:hypothetical protein